MDAKKVKEVNGVDIFFDFYTHRFYYWENAKKVSSVDINKLINKLNK